MRTSCLQSAYWYANNLVTLIMSSERFLNKASNYVLSSNTIQFVTFKDLLNLNSKPLFSLCFRFSLAWQGCRA